MANSTVTDARRTGVPKEHELFISMGPQHPSTHGVLRVLLKVDGEVVTEANPDIGYLHRCFEKIAEKRTVPMIIPYVDRTDYLAAITSEWAFVLAVEKLMDIEVPERAEYIRVIIGELQRIASHLIAFGTFAMDLGATTPFLYSWRERENLLDIFHKLTGARMLYNYFRPAGVRNDLYDGFHDEVSHFLDELEDKLHEYHTLLTGGQIFESRTKGVGVLSAEDAIAYGASGPIIRASGVPYDVRKAHPYSVYDRFEFDVPISHDGDTYARYIVRMQEFHESIKIVRQALEQIPKGDFIGRAPRRMRMEGDAYARVESPRGEVGVYLVGDGGEHPWRCHYRSPCFVHLQLLDHIGRGSLLADMVAIIASTDVVMGEVDR